MKGFLVAFSLFCLLGIGFFAFRWSCNAAETTYQQVKPSELLRKYEYFKDMSAAIDEKRATIEVFRDDLSTYDKKDFNYEQKKSEILGLISVHNRICADYNSAMVKMNYAFCNKGSLPATNLEPLPREYKPYILSVK